MNKVISKSIWIMTAVLWLYPIIIVGILNSQGKNITVGFHSIILPVVITLIMAVCALFPKYFFRQEKDYPIMRKVLIYTLLLVYYIAGATIYLFLTKGKSPVIYERIFNIGLGLFFIFMGNIMPKLRRNHIAGIRLPWTMTDDEVWRKVHYYAGFEVVIVGVLTIILAVIFPIGKVKIMFVVIPLLLLWCVFSIIHSYLIARKMRNSHN